MRVERSVCVGCRLDEFDQNAAAVLGVYEIHPRPGCAAFGGVVEQAQPGVAEALTGHLDIDDAECDLLDPLAVALEELADG